MKEWEDYLGALDAEKRAVVAFVLSVAMEKAPDALPAMPYGVPGLRLQGKPLIAVAAHKGHYGVYPFSPDVIAALEPLLSDLETAKGTIRFPYTTKPSKKLITELLRLRRREIG